LKEKVDISIIIVNYNVCQLLQKCIQSIVVSNNNNLKIEIIVIDNNSADASVETISKQFPEVVMISNNYNAGFPGANNQGLVIAKGEYIFFLNPDTELRNNSLQKLFNFIKSSDKLCLVAPKLLNTDLSLQKSIQPFISVGEIIAETFFLHALVKRKRGYFENFKNETVKVDALSGAAILMKKKVVDTIGMLDEELFWTEDMEFCYRASLHGIERIYFPNAEIIHHVGQSGKKNMNVMLSNQVLTKIRYFKKNHSFASYLTVKIFRLLHIISRIIIFGFLYFFDPINKEKFKAYLFTLNRFIKNDY
jgi:N-acetylglucosaminyl-diphospho-decaprenol L-rhamnosyltransferase